LILCPHQKKENGSGAVARDLLYLNQKFVAGVRFELTTFGFEHCPLVDRDSAPKLHKSRIQRLAFHTALGCSVTC
jgi:hypothetical protein